MVSRHLILFQLVIIFSVYGSTLAQEKQPLCSSDDLDILYSYCAPGSNTFFFSVEPCSLRKLTVWKATIFWIPRADLTVLNAHLNLWAGSLKALQWEQNTCIGMDDDYSFCGTLKGETINTTVRIRGSDSRYLKNLKGDYTVIFEVFSGLKEMILCMNYTLIIK